MPNSGQPPNQKFEAQDELDYLFANASPNPNREGCPSRDELVRVARLETPMGDAAYAHIVRCSPCFREMRALQQAGARRRRTGMWAVAAAAVVALILGASWWTAGSSRSPAVVAVTIDLRPFSVMRGDLQSPPPAAIVIPRARLDATIVLPLGTEGGNYDVQLRDERLSVRAAATGAAELLDSVTTLRVPLGTAALPAGAYRLELRRAGGEWLTVPARLK
ncbi:MAG: hypothetical protein JSU08_03405 [Acidobacteria bacterium]|nr:hypothetical protein [Acidobacteriota bacterium]